MADLRALALNCSLKPSPAESSTELLTKQVLEQLERAGVQSTDTIRLADLNIVPGVQRDMGSGDEWPSVAERILAADILVFATPTWLGHLSSIAQRALERLDGELSHTRDDGLPSMFGKVAVVAVVGNEDGAHSIIADTFQGLNDIGFTIPAQGSTYWNGEAMSGTDYKDLDETPSAVDSTNKMSARNAVHLAELLRRSGYIAADS